MAQWMPALTLTTGFSCENQLTDVTLSAPRFKLLSFVWVFGDKQTSNDKSKECSPRNDLWMIPLALARPYFWFGLFVSRSSRWLFKALAIALVFFEGKILKKTKATLVETLELQKVLCWCQGRVKGGRIVLVWCFSGSFWYLKTVESFCYPVVKSRLHTVKRQIFKSDSFRKLKFFLVRTCKNQFS